MRLFKPDIDKMKAKNDVEGLIKALNVMNKVAAIGDEQLHYFQLLGTHVICRGELIKRSRG
jgi:hypothetical protein